MASLRPRAADVRGNELQFLRAWYWCVRSLQDPKIATVTIEDPDAGSFDDIVVQYADGRTRYEQAKCSNQASVALGETTLTLKRTARGKSPLQHFYATWLDHRGTGSTFAIVSNRSIDPTDPILSTRDNLTGLLDGPAMRSAGARSGLGGALSRWQAHLNCAADDLLEFLSELRVETLGTSFAEHVQAEQRAAGLDDSENALEVGRSIARRWVMEGRQARSRGDIAEAVQSSDLLATNGLLRLRVHAIDRRSTKAVPNVVVDLQDLYPDLPPIDRHELRDPSWGTDFALPRLRAGVDALDEYGIRRVEVGGSMRLPYWFVVGQLLPETRNWQLSSEQGSDIWVLDERGSRPPTILADEAVDGEETALAICLTYDITDQVRAHMAANGIRSLLAITGDEGPAQNSVPDAKWVMEWARGAKELVLTRVPRAPGVHLFIAGPQSVALALGHIWNVLPAPTTYEWVPQRNEYVSDVSA